MTFKEKILLRYKELLQDRIDVFQDMKLTVPFVHVDHLDGDLLGDLHARAVACVRFTHHRSLAV